MTTESQHRSSDPGTGVLVGAALWTVVPGGLLVVVAALVAGSAAAYGALAGLLLVLVVFGLGTGSVSVVARLMPGASLLFALLTYTLQVVAMAAVFVVLDRSGLLEDALDRRWLGGAAILGTLVWLAAQIVLATRRRIPAYDVPLPAPGHHPEAGAR
jgi:ATP synthase protein I